MLNNTKTLSAQIREYNAWRRGLGIYDSEEPHPGPDPIELGLLLDTVADRLDRWHPVLVAAVNLVCAPSWAGVSDEDVALERALRNAGLVMSTDDRNESAGAAD